MQYPVLEIIPALTSELSMNPVVILQAPPGAGKSTVVPLQLFNEAWLAGRKIIMLEPRRLAARSVAARMASLLGEEVGDRIGFRIRFETKVSAHTQIEIVTEGILTRMIQSNPSLDEVGLIVFDEFHERSLNADLALTLTLQVQQYLRNDIRILIMSATLDGEALSSKLSRAPIVTAKGIQYPVEVRYLPEAEEKPIHVRMGSAIKKVVAEESGDVLAFLPGAGEINRCMEWLEPLALPVVVLPLYGDLSFTRQQQAIVPDQSGRRKVVLATSIAETSLTIEGIRIVIDSGYARVPRFDPRSGLTRLVTVRVTQDSATQRSGRAGRLSEGICYRLWKKQLPLEAMRTPEIFEADLASLVLEVKAWGTDITDLHWIDTPPAGAVLQAEALITSLEALDTDGKITERGKQMAALPAHPRFAHMLLISKDKPATASLATDLVALLEERDPLDKNDGTDISLRVNCLRKWRSGDRVYADYKVLERIERQAKAWRKLLLAKTDNALANEYDVGYLVAQAYPERIAKQSHKHGVYYKLANARTGKLPEHDPLVREPWIAVAHLDMGTTEGKIFYAAALEANHVKSIATTHKEVRWNNSLDTVEGVQELRIGSLIVSSTPFSPIPIQDKTDVLIDLIRREGLRLIGWNETMDQWQARVQSLRKWNPHEAWPDVSEEALLKSLDEWLAPHLLPVAKASDFKKLDLENIVMGILPWELQTSLDQLAPSRVEVPSGSRVKLTYGFQGESPVMQVRLQEIFGWLETPSVCNGSQRIILHLLSPGYKPVQVTQDLKSFWSTTYHEVRKELRRRYPKHAWPEDPWTAQAVRGVPRKK